MKFQLYSTLKASEPISTIVYATPSQTNLPPLKLKLPDAKKFDEQLIILHSLRLLYSIVFVHLSSTLN